MSLARSIGLAVLLASLSTHAFAWGGRVHMDINRAAALNVPDEMAAWRAYADLLGRDGIWPDVWKGGDETEGPRHYLDAERYSPLAITNLPRDHSKVLALVGSDDARNGLLPWVILDVENKLTQAMASNDWVSATRYAAALGHYVGDGHQPLHLTEHYDGSPGPDGKGIHMRWEERMPFFYWKAEMLKPKRARYLDDPWNAVLRQLAQAHDRFRDIYKADYEATRLADEDVESAEYYRAMWKRTGDLFTEQVSAAVTDLSSLWYTAWVNAGKPAIPKPPKHVSQKTVWQPAAKPAAGLPVWPVLAALAAVAALAVLLLRRAR